MGACCRRAPTKRACKVQAMRNALSQAGHATSQSNVFCNRHKALVTCVCGPPTDLHIHTTMQTACMSLTVSPSP